MSGSGNNVTVYAPLKQALSDSESDDDKLEDAAHKRAPAADFSTNVDYNSGLHSSKNCSPSDMDEFNTNVNTVESSMDNRVD